MTPTVTRPAAPADAFLRILGILERMEAALAPPHRAAPPPVAVPGLAVLTPDFASVRWGGRLFTFTPAQRAAVRCLYDAHARGVPWVSGAELLEAAESDSGRVRDLFRSNPGWGVVVRPAADAGGPRGYFRLAEGGAS